MKTTRVTKFDSKEQEAYLSIWRTYDRLKAIEDALFSEWNLSAQQYNLLRLVQASHPEKLPTQALGKKLISRAPDITRMMDKLESSGWIVRERSLEDRRTILVGITKDGLKLLKALEKPLGQVHEKQLGHLAASDLRQLCELLSRARSPHESQNSSW